MCLLFATTYPDRVSALVLYATYATRVRDADYPWAPTFDEARTFLDAKLTGLRDPDLFVRVVERRAMDENGLPGLDLQGLDDRAVGRETSQRQARGLRPARSRTSLRSDRWPRG